MSLIHSVKSGVDSTSRCSMPMFGVAHMLGSEPGIEQRCSEGAERSHGHLVEWGLELITEGDRLKRIISCSFAEEDSSTMEGGDTKPPVNEAKVRNIIKIIFSQSGFRQRKEAGLWHEISACG